MELKVYNTAGKEVGKTIKLNDAIFGIEPNAHAMYLDVKSILANKRQGTHKSKQRNEIAGSTKKLKRQKGTGGARAGSIKSPTIVGGGRAFGPVPRDYSMKINKKVKLLARKSALATKAKENSIIILDSVNFDQPKTKQMIEMQKNLQIFDKKILLVLNESKNNVYLSSRNLKGSKVVVASQLNTYDVLDAKVLAIEESALAVLEQNLLKD
ncbi:MAG TPA: 50S ribosomal protein L4 [Bacteroidales bacterium]|jgi:large subunit ribosomal protein L4|nr:50S ribosomal protein L4 [Bacteroidales bacterium]HOU99271.1 50S ribosomal protein L4 [Bacteroidales bacterium]